MTKLSWTQRFFRAIMPSRWFAAMEADSRMWRLDCECGYATSIWEMGGIRYKAIGNPWIAACCAKCGKVTTGILYKVPSPDHPQDGLGGSN